MSISSSEIQFKPPMETLTLAESTFLIALDKDALTTGHYLALEIKRGSSSFFYNKYAQWILKKFRTTFPNLDSVPEPCDKACDKGWDWKDFSSHEKYISQLEERLASSRESVYHELWHLSTSKVHLSLEQLNHLVLRACFLFDHNLPHNESYWDTAGIVKNYNIIRHFQIWKDPSLWNYHMTESQTALGVHFNVNTLSSETKRWDVRPLFPVVLKLNQEDFLRLWPKMLVMGVTFEKMEADNVIMSPAWFALHDVKHAIDSCAGDALCVRQTPSVTSSQLEFMQQTLLWMHTTWREVTSLLIEKVLCLPPDSVIRDPLVRFLFYYHHEILTSTTDKLLSVLHPKQLDFFRDKRAIDTFETWLKEVDLPINILKLGTETLSRTMEFMKQGFNFCAVPSWLCTGKSEEHLLVSPALHEGVAKKNIGVNGDLSSNTRSFFYIGDTKSSKSHMSWQTCPHPTRNGSWALPCWLPNFNQIGHRVLTVLHLHMFESERMIRLGMMQYHKKSVVQSLTDKTLLSKDDCIGKWKLWISPLDQDSSMSDVRASLYGKIKESVLPRNGHIYLLNPYLFWLHDAQEVTETWIDSLRQSLLECQCIILPTEKWDPEVEMDLWRLCEANETPQAKLHLVDLLFWFLE